MGGSYSPASEGVGESKFGRLEKKPSILSTPGLRDFFLKNSRIRIQRHMSADPAPYQNVTDPQHFCVLKLSVENLVFYDRYFCLSETDLKYEKLYTVIDKKNLVNIEDFCSLHGDGP